MNKQRLGIVVPHTHWDRAWYLPFQAYRLRLVEMMTELLDWLESGSLPVFVLDGQTVLLEEYLAVRPQDKDRIQTLVRAGRIKIGPWYTMPDCFLARPESLIRNLQRGLRMAEDLGGASRVGYVPDSFGHFAQLPQILSGLAIDSFLFMRGMPTELRDQHGALFCWRSPDGSDVLATFLREGYFPLGALGQESFHGRYDGLSADFDRARQRLTDTLTRLTPYHAEPVLVLPAGGDHLPAREDLAPLVEQLNGAQSDIELRFGTFEDYLSSLRQSLGNRLPAVYEGDLLGQADHPLLRNVLSSRVDLKILNHRAQSLLTGVVEPLLAWSKTQGLPCVDEALLQIAWDALLRNHAHDDICGCSVDDVHLDDIQRFHEILALGQEIITRQLEHMVQHVLAPVANPRSARVFVFNPHPWPVRVQRKVEIVLPDEGGEFSDPSPARLLRALNARGETIAVQVLATRCKALRNRYLETTWGRAYEVWIETEMPPTGFDVLTLSETEVELNERELMLQAASAHSNPQAAIAPANAHSNAQANASVKTQVPAELMSAFELELDADVGDGYSFGPCPEAGVNTARLVKCWADAQLVDVYHLEYVVEGYRWIRRDELNLLGLAACLGPRAEMIIAVRAHRHFGQWQLNVSYTNIFKDSRLRLKFSPQGVSGGAVSAPAKHILADGQAQWVNVPTQPPAVQLWDGLLAKPAYPGEKPYPVHHTNDGVVWVGESACAFVGGVGLHEFEVVPAGIALTLHRAVGYLSVRGGRIRSCQAGPQRFTPDAQLQKHIEHELTFGVASDSLAAMRALKKALHPCWVQEMPVVPVKAKPNSDLGRRPQALSASLLNTGSTPLEIMCLKPVSHGRGVTLRLLNPTGESLSVEVNLTGLVGSKARAVRTRLDEVPLSGETKLEPSLAQMTGLATTPAGAPETTLKLTFKPFEIQTWNIEPC